MLKKVLMITILLMFFGASTTFAEMGKKGMMGGGKMGSGMMMGMMGMMFSPEKCIKYADKIGLSDDQVEKLRTLHFDHKKKLIELNAEKDLKKLELKSLTSMDALDLGKIESKLKDLYDTKVKIKMEKYKTHKMVMETLTKEQMDKMKSLMMDKMMKKGGMKGEGMDMMK